VLYHVKDKAADDLQFIRRTLERASAFTAVPGWGGALAGVTALAAAALAGPRVSREWAIVWLADAPIAFAVGFAATIVKARRTGVALAGPTARRFALAFGPALAAGALLTIGLLARGAIEWLPAVWLLCYGAAVTSGGAFSVPAVPLMGAGFLVLGAAAIAVPSAEPVLMAIGFGVLQIACGIVIGRRYGG
jgi:hypothetical protein